MGQPGKKKTVGGWEGDLLRRVGAAVVAGGPWGEQWGDRTRAVHLAVVVEPYLSLLMGGLKTVESRFSRTRRAPWGCARAGDIVLVKRSSGPVVAIAEAAAVWEFEVTDPDEVARIRREFNDRVRGEPAFWASCAAARYGTLVEVARVSPVNPVNCHKRDQRGWVVLRPGLHRQ